MTQADSEPDDELAVRQSLAQSYTDAGRRFADHGASPEAERLWRKAAALDSENEACRQDLAALYERTDREQEALLVCEELVKIQPENPDYSLSLGLLNARLGRFATARSAVRRAIELNPASARYREVYEMIEKGE
jgi:Flp pilus assembly protein TadD